MDSIETRGEGDNLYLVESAIQDIAITEVRYGKYSPTKKMHLIRNAKPSDGHNQTVKHGPSFRAGGHDANFVAGSFLVPSYIWRYCALIHDKLGLMGKVDLCLSRLPRSEASTLARRA